MVSKRWAVVAAAFAVLLTAVAVAASGGAGSSGTASTHAYGIARASSVGTTNSVAATSTSGTTTFGPHVVTGSFLGTSPAVSSLPVPPVLHTGVRSMAIDTLKPGPAPPGVKDPVVQKQKGTGPISGPIQNFDGICLPGSTACALPS